MTTSVGDETSGDELLGLLCAKQHNQCCSHDSSSSDIAIKLSSVLLNYGLLTRDIAQAKRVVKNSFDVLAMGNLLSCSSSKSTNEVIGMFNDCVANLTKITPCQSFIGISLRQALSFLLNSSQDRLSLDWNYLLNFLDEFSDSIDSMCLEDVNSLKRLTMNYSPSLFKLTKRNASFLIVWALTEAAKCCVSYEFSINEATLNEYLDLFEREAAGQVKCADKLTKRSLLNFLHSIDKLLSDRILVSSTNNQTFQSEESATFRASQAKLQNWLVSNRQTFAELSIIVDDPAEAWRNINQKIHFDLTAKFSGSSVIGGCNDLPFSQTIFSLSAKNWHTNLNFITKAAKQLEDLDLLYGIRSLANLKGDICEYKPVSAVILNLEGRFDEAYNSVLQLDQPCEQDWLEFLNSCIELNRLGSNLDKIEHLKSLELRSLYKQCANGNNSGGQIEDLLPEARLEQIEQWLISWSDSPRQNKSPTEVQPMQTYLDLAVTAQLKLISKAEGASRMDLVKRVERLVTQDFLAQFLFHPNYVNKSLNIYYIFIEYFKHNKLIDESIVRSHSNDCRWNHLLYRHLHDLNLIEEIRFKQAEIVDSVQYKAIKFNFKSQNADYAYDLAQDLISRTSSEEFRTLSKILIAKNVLHEDGLVSSLSKIAKAVRVSPNLNETVRSNLISKLLVSCLDLHNADESFEPQFHELLEEESQTETPFERWASSTSLSDVPHRIRLLLTFSKSLNCQLKSSQQDEEHLLNQTFKLDLELLMLLCENNTVSKYKAASVDCAIRILDHIKRSSHNLSHDNLNLFASPKFFSSTRNIWLELRSNLTNLVCNETDFSNKWVASICDVANSVAKERPDLMLYMAIVERLDLQAYLKYKENPDVGLIEPRMIWLRDAIKNECENSSSKFKNAAHRLEFWDSIIGSIRESDFNLFNWSSTLAETELFIKEIRNISRLPGEYLKALLCTLTHKFNNFLQILDEKSDRLERVAASDRLACEKEFLEKFEQDLQKSCELYRKPIELLLEFYKYVASAPPNEYNNWLVSATLHFLKSIKASFTKSLECKADVFYDFSGIQKLVRDICNQLHLCQETMKTTDPRPESNLLFMLRISPILSKLKSTSILMPDYYCTGNSSARAGGKFKEQPITIEKTAQTLEYYPSLSYPKKVTFVGSDGVRRKFLLKYESLSCDHLLMNMFNSINNLLEGNKTTRNKHKLCRYSATPLSLKSGLIQLVEAVPLKDIFTNWFCSQNGRKFLDNLYSSTCEVVCEPNDKLTKPASMHTNCQVQRYDALMAPFHQLLWAKLKATKHRLGQQKPRAEEAAKYRAEVEPSIFESIVEQLANSVPQDLLSNRLWYSSANAHQFWLKTKQFTYSCATNSMVGYIIELGDRHTSNILLDCQTGNLINIDYGICFEPSEFPFDPTRRVPFRLTPSIVNAFGFAGLEGGFTYSCRNVLNVLKSSKSTLLHFVSPTNLSLKISKARERQHQQQQLRQLHSTGRSSSLLSKTVGEHSTLRSMSSIRNEVANEDPVNSSFKSSPKIELCSQESPQDLLDEQQVDDVSNLLILNNLEVDQLDTSVTSTGGDATQLPAEQSKTIAAECCLSTRKNSSSKQHSTAGATVYERVRDKLCGADDYVRRYRFNQLNQEKQAASQQDSTDQAVDLIMLEDAQSTEDQVEALINEATSLRNKAAMFEGWAGWL